MGRELTIAPAATCLAPGFRFHPTDEELVRYYLRRKVCGKTFRFQAVSEFDVYKCEPWELADFSQWNSRDQEWYFFSPVDRKYGNGSRLNRSTGQGYWKATGKDRIVRHKAQTIGTKKTLVFHNGRAPDGKRTDWVMHEYRLSDQELERPQVAQDAFVLCRIFQKNGLGPPNGDRYAPFLEEEWEDDRAHFVPGGGETEDDMANGDGTQNDVIQMDMQTIPFVCKRERSDDEGLKSEPELETISLFTKKSKQSDPDSSNANGSEDSTTSQNPITTNNSSALVEFPLLEPIPVKESQPLTTSSSFDASTLEKSVPPGYLKFISNLENEILNVSMEKETLKIEVMQAQAMISILQSRLDCLTEENTESRKGTYVH